MALAAEEHHLNHKCGVKDAFDRLLADGRCLMTTPFHRAANRLKEIAPSQFDTVFATVGLRGPYPDPDDVTSFYPTGITAVIVNGRLAVQNNQFTGVRAGRVLRGSA